MTMTVSVCSIMATLKREEDILALISTSLEVCGPDREVCEARPNEVASVREDVWSSLCRPVVGSFWKAGKWREE